MLRRIVATLLISIGGFAYAAVPPSTKRVDLSDARAMTKILDSNPAHYKKIEAILRGLERQGSWDVPRWMRTRFKAKAVSSSPFVLTTLPGQRDLSFVLDDTHYYGRTISIRGGGVVFLIRNR